jgi:hypothetical protein
MGEFLAVADRGGEHLVTNVVAVLGEHVSGFAATAVEMDSETVEQCGAFGGPGRVGVVDSALTVGWAFDEQEVECAGHPAQPRDAVLVERHRVAVAAGEHPHDVDVSAFG